MGISSYKEAERYRMRTNKNLTRSFYLDTRRTLDEEPFARDEIQDTSIEQQEAVQEFSDGGSVERQEYKSGSGVYERKNYAKEGVYKLSIPEKLQKKLDIARLEINKRNDLGILSRAEDIDKASGIDKGQINVYIRKGLLPSFITKEEAVIKYFNNAIENNSSLNNFRTKNILNYLNHEMPLGSKGRIGSASLLDIISKKEPDLYNTIFSQKGGTQNLLSQNSRVKDIAIKDYLKDPNLIKSEQAILSSSLGAKRDELRILEGKLKLGSKDFAISQAQDIYVKELNENIRQQVKEIGYDEWVKRNPNLVEYAGLRFDNKTNQFIQRSSQELQKYIDDGFFSIDHKNKKSGGKINIEYPTNKQIVPSGINSGYIRSTQTYLKNNIDKYGKDLNTTKTINNIINKAKEFDFTIGMDEVPDYQGSTLAKNFKGVKNIGGTQYSTINENVLTGFDEQLKKFNLDTSAISKNVTSPTQEEFLKTKEVMKGRTQNIEDVLNKVNKVKEEQSIRIAKSLNKEQSNLICSKLSEGGIPESCLDIAKNDPDRFLKTVASESKNIKAARDATKILTFANIADEALIGGKLGAGIIVGINTALAAYDKSEGKDPEVVLNTLTSVIPFLEQGLFGTPEYISLRKAAGTPEGYTNVVLGQQVQEDYTKLKDLDERIKEIKEGNVLMDIEQRPELTEEYMNNLLTQRQEIYSKLSPFLDREGNIDYTKRGPKDLLEAETKRQQESLKRLQLEEELGILKNYQIKRLGRGLLKLEDKASVGDVKEQIDLGQKKLEEFESGVKQENFDPSLISYEQFPNIESPDDSMMRQEFKKGGGPKISRRGLLGLLTGAAAAPELIKAFKGKKAAQAVRIASKINIEPAEGMYSWFPKLVEKVKEMGKPFEEEQLIMMPSYKNSPRPFFSRLPTGEEKLTKHVDGDTTFILREYSDGRIAVDIDSPRNQQLYGQPLSLYYRPKMEFKNYKGEKKIEPAEFKVLEAEPTLFANGPDDVDIDYTEVAKNPKRNTVFGDIEAAERFATGTIKNRKIIPVKQSLRNEMEEDPSTFIMRQSGELGSTAAPEEVIKSSEDIFKLPE